MVAHTKGPRGRKSIERVSVIDNRQPTEKQREATAAIRLLTHRIGIPPTLREISKVLGVGFKATGERIDLCAKKGLVIKGRAHQGRTLRAIEEYILEPERKCKRCCASFFGHKHECRLMDNQQPTYVIILTADQAKALREMVSEEPVTEEDVIK